MSYNFSVERMQRFESSVAPDYLRSVLEYNGETGVLFWKRLNKPAGYNNPNGYVMIKIKRRLCRAHRVIWAIVTGAWPENFIDHINGIGVDNRWANLRAATFTVNNLNRPSRITVSGLRRVVWHDQSGKWAARVKHKGKLHHLGLFDDPKMAYQVASKKAAELHGDLARFD
jgi:hypothetical protein